jgi:capsular polysaccharide biosynthesis protein
MNISPQFLGHTGILKFEQLRSNRVLSKDFSFWKTNIDGNSSNVLKRKHFDLAAESILFLDKTWTLFSGCGFLRSPNGNWILESFSFPYEHEFRTYFSQQKQAINHIHLNGIYFVFTNVGYSNYYHVLTELLPRLEFFMPFKGKVKLLVSEHIPNYLQEAFDLMGISKKDIQIIRDGIDYSADTLITIPWGLNFIPERFEFLKNALNQSNQDSTSKRKRIYVSRKSESVRSIANEDQLYPILDHFGFTLVESQHLSLHQQIDLFSEAEWICGPHGAGLSNLVWMNSPKVIEISPFDYTNECFLHVALACNSQFYTRIEAIYSGSEKTMTIEPEFISDLFENIL